MLFFFQTIVRKNLRDRVVSEKFTPIPFFLHPPLVKTFKRQPNLIVSIFWLHALHLQCSATSVFIFASYISILQNKVAQGQKIQHPYSLHPKGLVHIPTIFFLLASATIIVCGLEGYKRIYIFALEVRFKYVRPAIYQKA